MRDILDSVTDTKPYDSVYIHGHTSTAFTLPKTLVIPAILPSTVSTVQSENVKFCEQLRVNALSASVLPPTSLSLHIPETSWLPLFPPRSFKDAASLYTQHTAGTDIISQPPQLTPDLQAKFGPVVTDLYCMARARAPLQKLQLLTSAFRKTMASLSSLKLEALLEQGQ